MFKILVNTEYEKCFTQQDNTVSVYGFNDALIYNKLELNKILSNMNVRNDTDNKRAFYIGMATKVIDNIKLDDTNTLSITNYDMYFRSLFRNMSYLINESTVSSFNMSMFVDECMNIYKINIKPLLVSVSVGNVKSDTHHYITNITNVYSDEDLEMLEKYRNSFISGMNNLRF